MILMPVPRVIRHEMGKRQGHSSEYNLWRGKEDKNKKNQEKTARRANVKIIGLSPVIPIF